MKHEVMQMILKLRMSERMRRGAKILWYNSFPYLIFLNLDIRIAELGWEGEGEFLFCFTFLWVLYDLFPIAFGNNKVQCVTLLF